MSQGVAACPSCGARLDAPPGPAAYVHTCHYCGARISIEPLAPVAQPQPMRIEIAIPQARVDAAQRAGAEIASAGRKLGCFITCFALLPVLIPVFIFLGPTVKGLFASSIGSFPMSVGLNEDIEIDDRTATLDDTLVTIATNGKLTLKRCHLKGAFLAKAGTNAKITIVDSTIEGMKGIIDTDGPNVVLTIQNSTVTSHAQVVEEGSTNVKVNVSKKSKVTAADVAFPLSENGEVTIDDSSVQGAAGAIQVKDNAKVKLTSGAEVKSDGIAIDVTNNGHVQVTSSHVASTKGTALRGGFNLDATLRSATLSGAHAWIDAGNNARVSMTQTTVSGPKLAPKSATFEER